MRIIVSLLLAALVLTLPLTVTAAPSSAPSSQASIDIKSLALTKADLPRGFEIVPDRTVSEDRDDGVAIYDVTYARDRTPENLAAGPFEIRSGVARTARAAEAQLQLDSTKEAFVAEGWSETGVPALGDAAIGLTHATEGEGGQIAHYSYLFQKGVLIVMVGVRGRPDATEMEDALGLAIKVSGRIDTALAGGQPAQAGGQPSGPGSSGPAAGTGERARVINAEGGSVNVRAEPSGSAAVVDQVTEGTVLEIVGPNREADGRTWRNIRTTNVRSGWIASTFLETVAAPPPPAPSPAPSPAPRAPAPSEPSAPSEPEPSADEGGETAPEPPAPPPPAASPGPVGAAGSGTTASGTTFRGSGNGLDVEATLREANLTSGAQQVKVLVTRGGSPVADARVDITARLDATRYRAIKAPNTNGDGRSEIEWEMEGPPGTYEVLVEARPSDDAPATSATGSFRWR